MNGLKINSKLFAGTTVILISLLYLALTSMLEGLKPEHWTIIIFYNLCFFFSQATRRFILAFTIFVFFGIFYDLMKVYPNYLINPVDISSLYNLELNLFGFHSGDQIVTANEYFARNHSTFTDILTGLFYINWMPVPLAFAFYLFATDKLQFLHFSLTFLLVNLIGFALYYIHPAAPPWYVEIYGFEKHLGVNGSAAGLSRLDQLMHLPVFESIYSRNSNIFAALPSLHSAYPVIVFYYAFKNRMKRMSLFTIVFMAGIWFSAVYTGHHYVIDVILGILCAIAGILIFQKFLLNTVIFSKFIEKYKAEISSKTKVVRQ